MRNRIRRGIFFFFLIIIAAGLFCHTGSYGQDPDEGAAISPAVNQMVIESNNLEIDDQNKRVTFTGQVNARGNEFNMTCQKLDLYYFQPEQVDPGKPKVDVKKIVATGQVRIIRAVGGSASSEMAVYFKDEEKIVLTGNPRIEQGNDFVQGTKITLFLRERKSMVEGSEGNQVKAVVRIPESESEDSPVE